MSFGNQEKRQNDSDTANPSIKLAIPDVILSFGPWCVRVWGM
jgi:hypothetical protein